MTSRVRLSDITANPIHPKYRADIDGLRALAVLSVVGFHAFPSLIRSGFIGVDVFFVISGFLISTIIFENLERDRFSFLDFYARRIRRIFPALIPVLLACYALGWIALFADEFNQLGKHIAGGAGFVSNLVLRNESGYFDNAAGTKPLLHLWSLGIEEQFYLIWPLLLGLAWRLRLNLAICLIAVAAISFGLNVHKVGHDAVSAFYMPQTRFWELMVGSFLAYMTLHQKPEAFARIKEPLSRLLPSVSMQRTATTVRVGVPNCLSAFGIILIAASASVITGDRQFPGWWALMPTLGAGFVISAGQDAWLNRRILSCGALVWLGLISYPLYLWHWPLLSFERIIEGEEPSLELRIATIFASIALAWLTYTVLERPIRFGGHRKITTAALCAGMLVTGSLGYGSFQQNGLPSRTVVKINLSKQSGIDGFDQGQSVPGCGIEKSGDSKLFGACFQDSREPLKYAVIGDSKAGSIYPGLVRTSNENGRWLIIGGNGPSGAPVPVISDRPIFASYQRLANIAIKTVSENPAIETVALVTAVRSLFRLANDYSIEDLPNNANYPAALQGLTNATNLLIKAGKKIVIVVDNPTFPDPRDCVGRKTTSDLLNSVLVKRVSWRCRLEVSRHLELSKPYLDLLEQVRQTNPGKITIFDTLKYFCDLEKGLCLPFRNDRLLYSYSHHMSDYAAGMIGKDLNSLLSSRN
ncbi:acyltransferase family protein [Bradyrhizobium sp.]|uniref:acyltransferase family protein n=1 Tax=Bradyrhizobium sp. TaxID=376 RepID=UPI0026030DAD|nr:acyltransferase family protein [Bradyrhizobium sp.]